MNIFIDNNDLEEQYGEQKYKEYLEKENKQMKQDITTMNKEIKRLNNIINELEKELDRGYRDLFEHELVPGRELIANIKKYLQELKGVDKND